MSNYNQSIPGRRRWWTCACGKTKETVDGPGFAISVQCDCGREMRMTTIQAMCSCGQSGGHPWPCPPEHYAATRRETR